MQRTDNVVDDGVLSVVRQEYITVVGGRIARLQVRQVQAAVTEHDGACAQHSLAVHVAPQVRRLGILLGVRRRVHQTRQ